MPIRMVDDPNDPQDNSGEDSSGGGGGGNWGGGGGNGLFGLLPLLFGLFRGRGLIFVLVLLVGGYFLLGRGGCNSLIGGGGTGGNNPNNPNNQNGLFTGGYLDPNNSKKPTFTNPLDSHKEPPSRSRQSPTVRPPVGDQGHQGSCVAWSSAYGARTIAEAARTGVDPNSLKFSPSFLYNQIGLENCEGSYIERAMEFMTRSGSVPYNEFPYNDQDCSKQPDQQLLNEARNFKMRGFNRLTPGDRNNVSISMPSKKTSPRAPPSSSACR